MQFCMLRERKQIPAQIIVIQYCMKKMYRVLERKVSILFVSETLERPSYLVVVRYCVFFCVM